MEEYAKWKIVAWRFVRVFVAGFLVQLAFVLPTVNEFSWTISYKVILIPCLIAGITALGKAIREYASDENVEKLDKIII